MKHEIEPNKPPTNPDLPFSLACQDCDAGMDVSDFQQAVRKGWTGIEEDDGPWWNYIGLCRPCRRNRDKKK